MQILPSGRGFDVREERRENRVSATRVTEEALLHLGCISFTGLSATAGAACQICPLDY